MKVELIPCYTDRKLFLEMARDYIETLAEFDHSIRWDEGTWSEYMWESCFILESRTIQGFICKQEIPFKVYADALYIAEFYVVPDARGRGVGTAAVEELVRNWNGDVFLYILHENFTAKVFWGAVEKKLGWRRVQRPEIRQEPGCELRAFAKQ